eukprot:TRINITY_DN90962_c0_g1_i1.p1 TRINITY_DN90962_c0_g1~~TRINITY_DN90962_c0_g1_i1.p1  ORF type:complete len:471 (-),score=72.53 TRINITY_DN90962_c0_g1_i1:97-1509(-)
MEADGLQADDFAGGCNATVRSEGMSLGLEQGFLLLMQRAVLPLAGRMASMEDELRALRRAVEHSNQRFADAANAASAAVSRQAAAQQHFIAGMGRSAVLGGTPMPVGSQTQADVVATPSPGTWETPPVSPLKPCEDGVVVGPHDGPPSLAPSPTKDVPLKADSAHVPRGLGAQVLYEPGKRSQSIDTAQNGSATARFEASPEQKAAACSASHEQQADVVSAAVHASGSGADLADRGGVLASSGSSGKGLQRMTKPSGSLVQASNQSLASDLAVSVAGSAASGSGPVLAHAAVFFDFDSTLSTPRYLERAKDYALADRPQLCASLTRPEVLSNFGGSGRVARLHALLQRLSARGVALFVVAKGYTEAIRHQLGTVGLGRFFPNGHIFGQDSEDLIQAQHHKAVLIQRLMGLNSWPEDCVLFVDDDENHVNLCREMGACRTLLVRGEGISLEEMERIEATAANWTVPATPAS